MDDLDAVELGCGTGYVSSWLLRRGARPVGLDNSANQLATARRFQEEFSVSFPLVQGDAEDAPFPDESFDLVISEYGAAIWCDPYRWIPEAARMLHPGGRLRFLGHSPLAMLCSPYGEDVVPIDDRLVRDQFGMHRFDWSDVHVVQLGPDYARRVGSSLLAFAEDPGAFVRIGPDEDRVTMDAAVVTFGPGEHFWSTTVSRVRFDAGAVASALNEIRSLMRSRVRRAAAWSIGPSATPVDVVSALAALGLERESATGSSIMILTHEPDVAPSMFEVRSVTTYEDHLAAIEVANEGFASRREDADDERRRARETFEAEQAGGHTARLLALDRGRAVATGRAWFASQGIYLGGGATIPSHRRRGAMGSLIAAAWQEAVRRETRALVTSGGDMSTSPLHRMGFETAGRIDRLIDYLPE